MTTNRALYQHLLEKNIPFLDENDAMNDCLFGFLSNSSEEKHSLLQKIRIFNCQLVALWKVCHRQRDYFESMNENWLDATFIPKKENPPSTRSASAEETHSQRSGRPAKSFEEGSDKTKRRKLVSKFGDTPSEELLYAAQWKLMQEGKRNHSKLIKEASTPGGVERILNSLEKAKKYDGFKPYTPDEAATLLMHHGMTKRLYQFLREDSKLRCGLFIYPSYQRVMAAKRELNKF